jgi:hypothetical protein
VQHQAPKRLWSDEDTETARRLLKAKASDAEFRSILGRDKRAAFNRIAWLDRPDHRYHRRDNRMSA